MRFLLRILFFPLDWFADLPTRSRNWIRVRIFRSHKKIQVVQYSTIGNRAAIFAIYPGTSPIESIKRCIRVMLQSQISIVVLINENSNSEQVVAELVNFDISIIIRPNIGADFGAYQAGYKFLFSNKKHSEIRELFFINDSIYFHPKTEKFLREFFAIDAKWNCLFQNKQHVRHAASMLLKFKLDSDVYGKLNKFWRKYYPYSNKKKTIRRGEHRLSKQFSPNYFHPFIDEQIAIDPMLQPKPEEIAQLLFWSTRSEPVVYKYLSHLVDAAAWETIIEFSIGNLQVSNALGIYLSRVENIPLKMDLYSSGLATKNMMFQFCTDETSDEYLEYRKIINSKVNFTQAGLLERIRRS